MITVVKPSYSWPETMVKMFPLLVGHVERCGRICYKSEARITPGSSGKFVGKIRQNRHLSVLEHASVTAIVICSRAASHQLVRHRIAAYSQESQRFCNYGKTDSLQVICPPRIGLSPGNYFFKNTLPNNGWYEEHDGSVLPTLFDRVNHVAWLNTIKQCYQEYLSELADGLPPEDARYVLPNATKTELAVTFNLRQWRHVFQERALNKHAQWEIRDIFLAILHDLQSRLPAVFQDMNPEPCDGH